jgi:hypothetical protein
MIKKIILFSLVAFAFYYGGQIYVATRMLHIVPLCSDKKVISEMERNNASKDEKLKYARESWSCIQEKLSFIDSVLFKLLYFKIPETWLNQPANS